jgi:hypothetical protein
MPKVFLAAEYPASATCPAIMGEQPDSTPKPAAQAMLASNTPHRRPAFEILFIVASRFITASV